MPIIQSVRNAIGTFWRGVLSAVGLGQSAQQTTQATADQLRQLGIPVPSDLFTTIDQQTGIANSWISATLATTAAGPGDNITRGMITNAPWSMDPVEFNTRPGYHLVIAVNVEGQTEPVWRTVTGITDLPGTVGELRDLALANAHAMSVGTTPGGGLGGTVTGLSSVTVTIAPSGA